MENTRPSFPNVPPGKYYAFCQHCLPSSDEKVIMLTGFSLYNLKCDNCGRVTDLAMVKIETKAEHD